MAEAEETPTGGVAPLVIVGADLVAVTTPLNLVLLLLCWNFIAAIAGPAADTGGGGVFMLGCVVNVGFVLAQCGLAGRVFRRSSLLRRRVVVLVVHLGLWLGLSIASVAHMAATDNWL